MLFEIVEGTKYSSEAHCTRTGDWQEEMAGSSVDLTKPSWHSRRPWFQLIEQFLNSLSHWNSPDYSTFAKTRQPIMQSPPGRLHLNLVCRMKSIQVMPMKNFKDRFDLHLKALSTAAICVIIEMFRRESEIAPLALCL